MSDPLTSPETVWQWRQPNIGNDNYLLLAGDRAMASLTLKGYWGVEYAECRINGLVYFLRRSGLMRARVTIRTSPFNEDVAVVEKAQDGVRKVEMTSGRWYTFHQLSFWKTRWDITDEEGTPLASLRKQIRLLRREETVKLEDKGGKDENIALLLALSWFMTGSAIQYLAAAVCEVVGQS